MTDVTCANCSCLLESQLPIYCIWGEIWVASLGNFSSIVIQYTDCYFASAAGKFGQCTSQGAFRGLCEEKTILSTAEGSVIICQSPLQSASSSIQVCLLLNRWFIWKKNKKISSSRLQRIILPFAFERCINLSPQEYIYFLWQDIQRLNIENFCKKRRILTSHYLSGNLTSNPTYIVPRYIRVGAINYKKSPIV